MSNVSEPGPLRPREKSMYEQEYKHSADLFKRALEQYNKSDNPYQKSEFKHVMDQAAQVLNQTAHELMRKNLLDQNQKIEKDYATFQQFPNDPDTIEKLNSDLDQAKKLI